ncbi:hypothetical protein pb186bvf_002115 [Paramecium bursaria]
MKNIQIYQKSKFPEFSDKLKQKLFYFYQSGIFIIRSYQFQYLVLCINSLDYIKLAQQRSQ